MYTIYSLLCIYVHILNIVVFFKSIVYIQRQLSYKRVFDFVDINILNLCKLGCNKNFYWNILFTKT